MCRTNHKRTARGRIILSGFAERQNVTLDGTQENVKTAMEELDDLGFEAAVLREDGSR
jgi:hypothetical protein